MPDFTSARGSYFHRFSVATRRDAGVAIIEVHGGLDISSARAFAAAMAAVANEPTVVDLSDCDFVDSSGLKVIIETYRRDQRLAIVCEPEGAPARLLELTVQGTIGTHRDVAAATAELAGAAPGHGE